MAKVKLQVADNVTLNRGGGIRRPGEHFEAERDDEVEQWLRLGYVSEIKRVVARPRRAPGVRALSDQAAATGKGRAMSRAD